MRGLASKVTSNTIVGFAARCEAVALHRRSDLITFWALPLAHSLDTLEADKKGPQAEPGRRSPVQSVRSYGGAEPPPHIGRRSRNHGSDDFLGQSHLQDDF